MKRTLVKQFIGAIVLGTSLALAGGGVNAAETEAKVAIPATASGIWQAIDNHIAKLKELIAQNKLDTVHEHAYAVRDLVRALPSHTQGLSAEALAKVQANARFVNTLAERLDASGDAKDKTGTESNLRKLEAVLKQTRAQYPNAK